MNVIPFPAPQIISIHALREEGGVGAMIGGRAKEKFQSTPSARRAAFDVSLDWLAGTISIHALREEGGVGRYLTERMIAIFQSTPSARRAARMRVDHLYGRRFQSTPSARRAAYTFEDETSKAKFQSTPSARRAARCARR